MYMKQQRYAEAESAFLAAYQGYAKSANGENANTWRVVRGLAEMYVATGQPTKAAEWQAKLPKEPSPSHDRSRKVVGTARFELATP